MAHRALACALERLAPFYRERTVSALAQAFADDADIRRADREYLDILDASDIKRAHRLALAMQARRDAAHFERRLARRVATIKMLVRRLAKRIGAETHNRNT
jgi:hypothetical protein